MTSSTGTSTSDIDCYVDSDYYPDMFLIPACAIFILMSFLKKRQSFRTNDCGGIPGIVVPIDFFEIDHKRLAISAVFGAATGMIVQLVISTVSDDEPWKQALHVLYICLRAGLLCYPFFACLSTSHKTIGSIVGLSYGVCWFAVTIVVEFDKCHGFETPLDYIKQCVLILPDTLCKLFVIGKFAIDLVGEIKKRNASRSPLPAPLERPTYEKEFVKAWVYKYAKDLLKPRFAMLDTKAMHYVRKIYSPARNFAFSTQTVSVVVICCIVVYKLSFGVLILSATLLNLSGAKSENNIMNKFSRGFGVSLLVSTCLTLAFCSISIIRFMECHKNNMLRMFKGAKSFIPRSFTPSHSMAGRSIKYACFQIGYLIWGYILLLGFFCIVVFAFYSLSFHKFRVIVWYYAKGLGVVAAMAMIIWMTLPLLSQTVFRDRSFSSDVIVLNNRNVYLVFAYFWFFVGLPMGLFSAFQRVLKAMAVGLLLLPRIDRSVMPVGFQRLDPGFYAYVCYLYFQATYRNPVLRVFCQILYDAKSHSRSSLHDSLITLPPGSRPLPPSKLRNKWFLLLTLARNPQLVEERKHALTQKVRNTRRDNVDYSDVGCNDITVEVSKYGPLN